MCQECGSTTKHEFYDKEGELRTAQLIATNSSHSWRKVLCHNCWEEFSKRAFTSIERTGATFTATCAF